MKIALYYPWVYLTSGAERTILELVTRGRHQWTIFTNRYERENTFPGLAGCEIVELSAVSVKRSPLVVARAGLRLLTQRLPLEGYDALVVVCEGLGDLVVFRNGRLPTLCFCLTPLRIAFDREYRRRYFAEHGLARRAIVTAGTAIFRAIDRLAWRRYEHVMCISQEVRNRVLAGRLASEDRLEVVHVGLGFEPPAPSGHFGDYFLLPGRIMWTKNIALGIRAFQRFRAERPQFARFRLVIAGIVDRKSEAYMARLRELVGDDMAISFKVHPSDAELAELYDNCYGVLFTAFNEDWGIVPIEGMAFGKPVIAANRGGPRESIHHGVQGFLEEPEDAAFARRMVELAADPEKARAMGAAGRVRARDFDWNRLASRVEERLERMVADGAGLPAVSPAVRA